MQKLREEKAQRDGTPTPAEKAKKIADIFETEKPVVVHKRTLKVAITAFRFRIHLSNVCHKTHR